MSEFARCAGHAPASDLCPRQSDVAEDDRSEVHGEIVFFTETFELRFVAVNGSKEGNGLVDLVIAAEFDFGNALRFQRRSRGAR
jgi:hypothetical protein